MLTTSLGPKTCRATTLSKKYIKSLYSKPSSKNKLDLFTSLVNTWPLDKPANVPALSCRKVKQVIGCVSVLYLHCLFNLLRAVSSTYMQLLYIYLYCPYLQSLMPKLVSITYFPIPSFLCLYNYLVSCTLLLLQQTVVLFQ